MSLTIDGSIQQIQSIYRKKQNRFIYLKVNGPIIHDTFETNSRISAAWHCFKNWIQCCCPSNAIMIGGERNTENGQKAINLLAAATQREVAKIETFIKTAPTIEVLRTYRTAMNVLPTDCLSNSCVQKIQDELTEKETALERLEQLHDIVESIPEAVELRRIATRMEIAESILQDWSNVYNPFTREINGKIAIGSTSLFVERNAKSKIMTVLHLQKIIGSGSSGTVQKVHDLATGRFGALKYGAGVHKEAANLKRLRELGIKGVQPEPWLVTTIKTPHRRPKEQQAMVGKLYSVVSMKYPDLNGLIKKGGLSHKETMEYVAKVIGLYWQIRGKVHHVDMKPPNLLLDEASSELSLGDWAYMIEFHSGRIPQQTSEIETSMTPEYTPQEVIAALQSADPDVRTRAALFGGRFSMGVTLFELITGKDPHEYIDRYPSRRDTTALFYSTVPEELKKCIIEMCSLEAPRTVEEFWKKEGELDACLKKLIASGEIPPIPTYE